jgi:hypothetical protein
MKRVAIVSCLALVVTAGHATAQETPKLPEGPNEHMKPFAFLIGTWSGEGEMPGLGKFTDETVYEWAVNKQFLATKYVAKGSNGEVVWTDCGMTGWDAEKKAVVSFGFGMDGSIGRGAYLPSDKKDTWVAEGTMSGGEIAGKWRSTMVKTGDDTMTVSMEIEKDGKFAPFLTAKYKKKPGPAS